MINFKQYLLEAEQQPEGKPLKHLRHLEDNAIYDGHGGVERAANFLDDAHKALQGKNSSTHFSTKYDGAPSIVFGHHPQTGQFFVASKSAFNKNPKINYTPEDIEANHGHAPGLVEKLKSALEHSRPSAGTKPQNLSRLTYPCEASSSKRTHSLK